MYCAFSQKNILIDTRDNNHYQTVQIGEVIWMAENLRYFTKNSYCSKYELADSICLDTNFYSFEELSDVCPLKWRIATIKDWKGFVDKSVNDMTFISFMEGNPKKYRIDIDNGSTGFFDESNILNLQPTGRVEGGIWWDGSLVDYWTKNSDLGDNKFHMHITNRSIAGHAHKHHIIDKLHRIRKFAVRCVTDLD